MVRKEEPLEGEYGQLCCMSSRLQDALVELPVRLLQRQWQLTQAVDNVGGNFERYERVYLQLNPSEPDAVSDSASKMRVAG